MTICSSFLELSYVYKQTYGHGSAIRHILATSSCKHRKWWSFLLCQK